MGDDYAIVVGIDKYVKMPNGLSFPPLSSAVEDANKFITWLRSPNGGAITETLPQRRIISIFPTLINTNEELPTLTEAKPVKDQIDDAMAELGIDENRKRIGDRLYFYFSGHGIGLGSNDVAMMMANAFRAMESRNIGLRPYREFLQERHFFDEIIFIIDCCRNRETKLIELGKPGFVIPKSDQQPPVQDVAILAAEYGAPAFAVKGGQGLLTKALIEGLDGIPESVDQLGRVTSNTLNDFIPKRVAALAKENQVSQKPEVDPFPKNAEIIFCKPKKKIKIQITTNGNIKGNLIVCDGQRKPLDQIDATLVTPATPWEVELFDSAIPYFVQMSSPNKTLLLDLSEVKRNGNVFQIS